MQYANLLVLAVSAIGPNAFALPHNTLEAAASLAAPDANVHAELHPGNLGPILPVKRSSADSLAKRYDCVAHPNLPKCAGTAPAPVTPAGAAQIASQGAQDVTGALAGIGEELKRDVDDDLQKRYDCVAHPNLPKCAGTAPAPVTPAQAAQIAKAGAEGLGEAFGDLRKRDMDEDLQKRYDCVAHPNLPKCAGTAPAPVTPAQAAQIAKAGAEGLGEAFGDLRKREATEELQKRYDCVAHPHLPKCAGTAPAPVTPAEAAQIAKAGAEGLGEAFGDLRKREATEELQKRYDCVAHPNLPACQGAGDVTVTGPGYDTLEDSTKPLGPYGTTAPSKRDAEPTAAPEADALDKRVDCGAHPNLPGCLKYASTTSYFGVWRRDAEPTAAPEAAPDALDKRVDCGAHPNLPGCLKYASTTSYFGVWRRDAEPTAAPEADALDKRVDCGAHPNLPGCLKYATTTSYDGVWRKRSQATPTPSTTLHSTWKHHGPRPTHSPIIEIE
ncbi:MAG: hypothetical protein M1828_000815 [Chrysothrix sp. TS-e1954]|nr:MAG: hypothetical protein M1828_000815 [Chrysothrix sp. TS-e1954]